MMNDGFILDRAGYLVARIAEIAGSDAPAVKKIEASYLLAFPRKPKAAEVQLAETHLQRQKGIYLAANEPPPQASAKSNADPGSMLLSSNEFLYIG